MQSRSLEAQVKRVDCMIFMPTKREREREGDQEGHWKEILREISLKLISLRSWS